MRKDKLIELLQNIPGNPNIVIWNGFVDDIQHITTDIPKLEFKKISKKTLKRYLAYEESRDTGVPYDQVVITDEQLNSAYRNYKFELPNQFMSEEEQDAHYAKKKVYYCLQLKTAGKTYWDRLGTVNY